MSSYAKWEITSGNDGSHANAVFIEFTDTPLLKKDKATSLEVFGKYIHTYKFDEAVEDGVMLDLVYEAGDIEHAPTCTYLYIDKSMQDHGLFQAICRVNRLNSFRVNRIRKSNQLFL